MDKQIRYETIDLPFYHNEVAAALPPVVLDFHTHTWTSAHWNTKPWEAKVKGGKYMVTWDEYPPKALLADGQKCFPDQEYSAVCFGWPLLMVDRQKDIEFVAEAGKSRGLYPLMLVGKDLNILREQYERELRAGQFFGYKVLINWVGNDYGDKTVEDMLSATEMKLADDFGLIVLLHVPRNGRLADPVVQHGVEKLSKDYPNAHIVLAHCGRCYLPAEMKKAIHSIADLDNVFMDTAMVMDATVLQMAMETIGSHRLVFGTDFPVAAMRGRRVRIMDHWVDVVLEGYPQSAYRVQSNDIRATFMALEIVVAIRDAAERVGISEKDLLAIFYENGMRLLRHVMGGEQFARVQAGWAKRLRE